ncbi:hypothetical protein VDGL01_02242 [Verticillium dahliae]
MKAVHLLGLYLRLARHQLGRAFARENTSSSQRRLLHLSPPARSLIESRLWRCTVPRGAWKSPLRQGPKYKHDEWDLGNRVPLSHTGYLFSYITQSCELAHSNELSIFVSPIAICVGPLPVHGQSMNLRIWYGNSYRALHFIVHRDMRH